MTNREPLDYYLKLRYPLTFYPEAEGGYTVAVLDLPGCLSQGETLIAAQVMILDAKEQWIRSAYEHGDVIPLPSTTPTSVPKDGFGVDLEGIRLDQLRVVKEKVEARIRELSLGSTNTVHVESIPRSARIPAIRSVRSLGGLSLKLAHDLCANPPFDLVVVVNDKIRDEEIAALRKIGCVVTGGPS